MKIDWQRALDPLTGELADRRWLIVDPPSEPVPIPAGDHCYWSASYPVWNRLPPDQRATFDINFPEELFENILVFQSRSASRSEWLWRQAIAAGPGGRMVVAAGNRAGGKVTGRRLKSALGLEAGRISSQGRASLWQARLPPGPLPGPDPWQVVDMADIEMRVLPGVFGRKGLDPGTALLLEYLEQSECLEQTRARGPVLDFACGSGILALAAMRRNPHLDVTACDADILALESARANLAHHGFQARIRAVASARDVTGSFGLILSNPPFHEGARPELDIAAGLIRVAPALLACGGILLLVANRHLPLERDFDVHFADWEKCAENGRFKVLAGLEPRRRRTI